MLEPLRLLKFLLLFIMAPNVHCLFSPLIRIGSLSLLPTIDIPTGSYQEYSDQRSLATMDQVPEVSSVNIGFLANVEFKGKFQSEQKSALFQYLTTETGQTEAFLYESEEGSLEPINSLALLLFDPVYHDKRVVRLIIKIGNISSTGTWSGVNEQVRVQKIWKERIWDNHNVSEVNYTIKIKNIKSEDTAKVTMELKLESENFRFVASLKQNQETLSTLGYCFYVTFAVALQIGSLYVLLQRIETLTPNVASKLSLTTVATCNIEDFYLTMVHIEYIMTSTSSSYLLYIFPSVAYIVLFVIFDMKLLFLAWRAHYMREIDNPQALRKKLTTFYIKFYVGLFGYLTLTYFFYFDPWMIILQNMLMLPQIVHNARIGNNPGFEPLYLFGYLGARFLIPLYERSCPSNHFLLAPMPGLVIALALLYSLQILFLFLQFKLGPRFFIPKMLQPDYFDYNHKIKFSEDTRELECSICLQSFFEDQTNFGVNGSTLETTMLKEVTIMKTPCSHCFHRECLLSWIDVKLECPSCRSPLPPV